MYFAVGGVNVQVYWHYVAAMGGVGVLVVLALGFVLDQATKVGGDWYDVCVRVVACVYMVCLHA